MAKWTLGILDGGGWGVGGLTTGLYSCRINGLLQHNALSRNQTTADIRNHELLLDVFLDDYRFMCRLCGLNIK